MFKVFIIIVHARSKCTHEVQAILVVHCHGHHKVLSSFDYWRVEYIVYCMQKYKSLAVVLVIVVDNHDKNSTVFFSKISHTYKPTVS